MPELKEKLKKQGEIYLALRIRPQAAANAWRGQLADDSWKLDIAAPATGGRANQELLKFLAEQIDLPDLQIKLISGAGSRHKLVKLWLAP